MSQHQIASWNFFKMAYSEHKNLYRIKDWKKEILYFALTCLNMNAKDNPGHHRMDKHKSIFILSRENKVESLDFQVPFFEFLLDKVIHSLSVGK